VQDVLNGHTIERVTDTVLQALARDEPPTAAALTFLLRRYSATARDDLRNALEPALARGLELWPHASSAERAGWLSLFAEAAAASDDERLRAAAVELTASLRADWGRATEVDATASGLDACLSASEVLLDRRQLVSEAIDELERIVGAAYRPGEGVAHGVGRDAPRGRLADQVAAASALLTAHQRTGRLPYSMLAEELMQFARRTLWDSELAGFYDGDCGAKPFALNCEAARVLCRLALLHGTDEYRAAAVIASDADYGRDAALTLIVLAPAAEQSGLLAAVYGLAVGDWLQAVG
jgi:hypothetical protein